MAATKFNRKQQATKLLKNKLLDDILNKEVKEVSRPFNVPTRFLHEDDDDDD